MAVKHKIYETITTPPCEVIFNPNLRERRSWDRGKGAFVASSDGSYGICVVFDSTNPRHKEWMDKLNALNEEASGYSSNVKSVKELFKPLKDNPDKFSMQLEQSGKRSPEVLDAMKNLITDDNLVNQIGAGSEVQCRFTCYENGTETSAGLKVHLQTVMVRKLGTGGAGDWDEVDDAEAFVADSAPSRNIEDFDEVM